MIRCLTLIIFISWCMPILALEINNFKAGYACTDGKTFGSICHQTEDIYLTGQGTCVYNKKAKPCTWFGFEFEYKNYNNEILVCHYQASDKISQGNPNEVLGVGDKGNYSFKLDNQKGRFYNPQYMVLSFNSGEPSVVSTTTQCFVDDKLLFEFKHNVHFPIRKLDK